jgi:two-component system sensor histidine kinase AlgZ
MNLRAIGMDNCKRNRIARILAINTGVALVPTIIISGFSGGFEGSWKTFAVSMLYAHTIGGLAHSLIPRTWPLLARFRTPWAWVLRVALMLGLAVGGTFLVCLIILAIGWVDPENFWATYFIDLRIVTVLTLAVGTGLSLYESMRAELDETTLQLRTRELERERSLKLATEAQLALLSSRVQPHFLFNTLNSISSLIQDDPQKAERLVERMAALLRFSLDSHHAGLVSLDREMKIVADYLEIEKTRFGDRLHYRIDMPPDLAYASVPPLSVQTLVENSVKYVVSPSRSGGEIRISGRRGNAGVRLEIADSGPGFELNSVPEGHGIDNLRGRLAALFGDKAELTVAHRDGLSAVVLSIPQNGTPT